MFKRLLPIQWKNFAFLKYNNKIRYYNAYFFDLFVLYFKISVFVVVFLDSALFEMECDEEIICGLYELFNLISKTINRKGEARYIKGNIF